MKYSRTNFFNYDRAHVELQYDKLLIIKKFLLKQNITFSCICLPGNAEAVLTLILADVSRPFSSLASTPY